MAGHSQGYPYDDDDDLDAETFLPGRGLVRRSFVAALLAAVATTAGLFFALRTPQERPVPALVGVSLAKARSLLAVDGLALIAAGRKADPLVAAGSISLQDPLAGRTLPAGGSVIVLVSTGVAQPARAASPALAPKPAPVAPSKAAVAPTPAPTSPPPPTPSAPPRRAAEPTVATGSTVMVPKLTGVRLKYALPRLRRAGLILGSVSYRRDEDHMAGYVLRQKPAAGVSLPRGSKLRLVVNRVDD